MKMGHADCIPNAGRFAENMVTYVRQAGNDALQGFHPIGKREDDTDNKWTL